MIVKLRWINILKYLEHCLSPSKNSILLAGIIKQMVLKKGFLEPKMGARVFKALSIEGANGMR